MRVGDVVRHKAGSYRMAIESIREGNAFCTWFNDRGEPMEGTFALTSLEPWPEDEVPPPIDDEDPYAGGRSRVTGY